MTRLSRESVEQQISEMWQALADCPRDADYDQATRAAQKTEARLRKQLADQERLDEAAPDLLAACKAMLARLEEYYAASRVTPAPCMGQARAAIAKTEG